MANEVLNTPEVIANPEAAAFVEEDAPRVVVASQWQLMWL